MKPLLRMLAVFTAIFALLLFGCSLLFSRCVTNRNRDYRVAVNRINQELNALTAEQHADPEAIIREKLPEWSQIYGSSMPVEIQFLPAEHNSRPFTSDISDNTVICSVADAEETLLGFTVYRFSADTEQNAKHLLFALIAVCWLISCGITVYLHFRILAPFRKLSDYPAHIAKLPETEKLPETRDRRFGKFIWGMNMLNDVLKNKQKHIEQMESQRQTILASIAHGVKTPVANIRLYAEAIGTGLYDENSMSSQEIAEKITANAQKIEALTAEMIRTAAQAVSAYQPEIEPFYLKELAALTEQEYSGRLELSRIPFTVTCSGNPLIHSDMYGLFRIISQLINNACKYGNGKGIAVMMQRQEEGFSISVRNRGELLPEQEMPFVFGSFWRGSNAREKEGSGIGLYISQKIAAALGGRIFARGIPDTGEMEFSVFFDSLRSEQ